MVSGLEDVGQLGWIVGAEPPFFLSGSKPIHYSRCLGKTITPYAKAGPESVGERGDMAKQLVQDFGDRSGDEPRAMEESCDRAACRLCGNAQVGTKIGGLNRPAYELYTELARWGDTGDRSSSRLGGRKVRTPRARTLDNIQAERSDTSTTENKPPMAAVGDLGFFRRLR